MSAGEIASYLSLALAVIFWLMSTKQANNAEKTLNEIKSAIITWQAQLNKSAIDIISSRPEVIARETAIEETKALSNFSTQLSELITKASLNQSDDNGGSEHQLQVLDKLLDHHKNLILGKQQLLNQAMAFQTGKYPTNSETK